MMVIQLATVQIAAVQPQEMPVEPFRVCLRSCARLAGPRSVTYHVVGE
jgi:hypothetical protein